MFRNLTLIARSNWILLNSNSKSPSWYVWTRASNFSKYHRLVWAERKTNWNIFSVWWFQNQNIFTQFFFAVIFNSNSNLHERIFIVLMHGMFYYWWREEFHAILSWFLNSNRLGTCDNTRKIFNGFTLIVSHYSRFNGLFIRQRRTSSWRVNCAKSFNGYFGY